jgi:hypothetical protein
MSGIGADPFRKVRIGLFLGPENETVLCAVFINMYEAVSDTENSGNRTNDAFPKIVPIFEDTQRNERRNPSKQGKEKVKQQLSKLQHTHRLSYDRDEISRNHPILVYYYSTKK